VLGRKYETWERRALGGLFDEIGRGEEG